MNENRNDEKTPANSIAIAHWSGTFDGGGERVAWELSRTFDNAPLYVGYRDPSIEPDDIDNVHNLFGEGLTGKLIDRGGMAEMLTYQYCWQNPTPLRDADVLITSGNEPLAYVPHDDQVWIAYCHHTGRKQTDLLDDVKGGIRGGIEKMVYYVSRVMYAANTSKPDLFVANSEIVARRLNRYWGVPESKIRVVYPPTKTETFGRERFETGDQYLCFSRLDWHKKIGPVIDAFRDEFPDRELVIAGDGSERDQLEDRAAGAENIRFVGYVNEAEKRDLLSQAYAYINNAQAEDFGLTTVEALASGTPVIGVEEGMTQFLAADGRAGITYERGELPAAIERFESEGIAWSEQEIEAFAERFSAQSFRKGMHEAVEEAREYADCSPEWIDDPIPIDQRALVQADGGDRK